MTTMPLTYPVFSRAQPARLSTLPTPFQPLDASILDTSIPTFYIGRNRDGFWLARDVRGEHGGIFLFRTSALAFARRASRPHGCATILLSERFELDVKNQGNPFISHLKPLLRLFNPASRDAR